LVGRTSKLRQRLRKKILVLLPVAALIADVVLANIPGPIPMQKAVFNAEHDPAFLSLTRIVINGSKVNGTYYYFGYSNDPSRDFFCVHNLYEMWLHYLNPFHQYTTTTLVFAVTFQTPPYSLYGVNLFLQVNPTTGHIYNTKESLQCAGPPPPP